ncbi:MAG: LysM peptidoglycan-binding domain-containing protein [Parachlamydiaceae bacterium]|nr:LysM peptidoglycan-binding domain-containing protein [Parachlamydiaceae bacterium]
MYYKHTKRVIGALAVSGFLNILLLTSMSYWIFKERSPALYCEQKPVITPKSEAPPLAADESSSQWIRKLQVLPYEQLLKKLKSTTSVENGYSERDLALACLIAFHHFDFARALEGYPYKPQKRVIAYGRRTNGTLALITVYPGLSETHFASIGAFAENELWPQTPKGLFLLLKANESKLQKISLMDSFFLTSEFAAIEPLFRRLDPAVERNEIVAFLLQGDFAMLAKVAEQQRQFGDLSETRRQNVLLEYVQKGSVAAAELLLKIDGAFAAKKLDDHHVLSLLTLLTEKTVQSEQLALALLKGPRSDAVWKMAAQRLYDYAGEGAPENFHYQSALLHFVPSAAESMVVKAQNAQLKGMEKPQVIPEKKVVAVPLAKVSPTKHIAKMSLPTKSKVDSSKGDYLYIVQEGDNLWKLSRKYNVEVDVLRHYNRLSSDNLAPSTAIRIPKR